MAPNYAQLKASLIEDSIVTTILGIPIEFEGGEQSIVSNLSVVFPEGKFIPIWGDCYCVQDSPENPCPCRGPIIWLPREKIRAAGKTGKKDADDNEIYWYKLEHNAEIVVDAQIPSTARQYVQALRRIQEKAPPYLAAAPVPHPITLVFYGIMIAKALLDTDIEWEDVLGSVDLKTYCKQHPDKCS